MKKELKICIENPDTVKEKLAKIGAIFSHEDQHYYIYLKQPEGRVYKITKNNDGFFKTILEANQIAFTILENTPITGQKAEKLEKKYGIKRKMQNLRQFYKYQDMLISLNNFPDIGNFLIIESENPSIEFVKEELKIKNPEIITSSFDNL